MHNMFESDRMTVEQFFDWQQTVEGRYELIDGRIVPHPDYVTPHGLAAPSNRHAAIVGKLAFAFQSTLQPPCLVYVGAGAKVDRMSANIPDLAVSCDRDDLEGKALKSPRFICEVLSPSTRRVDTLRKVGDYLAIASVEAYIIVDGERRTITVHRPDAGPQTWDESATIRLSDDVTLRVADLLA
jgi:Uma2 family endonuclease